MFSLFLNLKIVFMSDDLSEFEEVNVFSLEYLKELTATKEAINNSIKTIRNEMYKKNKPSYSFDELIELEKVILREDIARLTERLRLLEEEVPH